METAKGWTGRRRTRKVEPGSRNSVPECFNRMAITSKADESIIPKTHTVGARRGWYADSTVGALAAAYGTSRTKSTFMMKEVCRLQYPLHNYVQRLLSTLFRPTFSAVLPSSIPCPSHFPSHIYIFHTSKHQIISQRILSNLQPQLIDPKKAQHRQ
jgi:hypothetical protein